MFCNHCIRYFKFILHHHTWVYINKANLRDLIAATGLVILFGLCDLKLDQWPWEIIQSFFHASFSFVCHFIDIGEFSLDLQSGNTQIGSNLMIPPPPPPPPDLDILQMTMKNIGHLIYTHWSFRHHFIAIGQCRYELHSGNAQIGSNWRIFAFCDLKILWMMLK